MLKISIVILSTVSFSLAHADRQYDADDIQRISPASARDRVEKCKRALDHSHDDLYTSAPTYENNPVKPNKQMGGFPGPLTQYTEKLDHRQMGGTPDSDNQQQH